MDISLMLGRAALMASLVACLQACSNGGTAAVVIATPPPPAGSAFDTAEYRASNGLSQLNVLPAYDRGATGLGVPIGIIDTGLEATNAEFAGRVSPIALTFLHGGPLDDPIGHGTAVASAAAGDRNGFGSHGVAFSATIVAFKIVPPSCGERCAPTDPDFLRATDNTVRAIDTATANGVRILNFSLGASSVPSAIRDALVRTAQSGAVLVFAAGNDGRADPNLLAQVVLDPRLPAGSAVVVGSVDANNVIAVNSDRAGVTASNYLVLPGENVLLARPGNQFSAGSGTSWAAARASGALALVIHQQPTLTPQQALRRLIDTATDLGAPGTDAVYGRGLVNVGRAVLP
jgi:subtilisin family serine protease